MQYKTKEGKTEEGSARDWLQFHHISCLYSFLSRRAACVLFPRRVGCVASCRQHFSAPCRLRRVEYAGFFRAVQAASSRVGCVRFPRRVGCVAPCWLRLVFAPCRLRWFLRVHFVFLVLLYFRNHIHHILFFPSPAFLTIFLRRSLSLFLFLPCRLFPMHLCLLSSSHVSLSVCLSASSLTVWWSLHLSLWEYVCVCLSVSSGLPDCLSLCLSAFLSVFLCVYLYAFSSVFVSVCLSVSLSVSLPLCLSVCPLFVCVSVRLFVCF